jgi:pimeloyl-ACP methyl ester carboxylesterase
MTPARWARRSGIGKLIRLATMAGLLLASLGPASPNVARAQSVPGGCIHGSLPHGSQSLICVPVSGWNGVLIVWAHGFVAPNEPLTFGDLNLTDGTPIPQVLHQLGFAFAATTYRANGLVVLEGVEDLTELIEAFPRVTGRLPSRTYVVGTSEGALIATLLAERAAQRVDGVLAACGPIGDFAAQIQYLGDFRVLFDVYFPGVIPGSAVLIPQEVIDRWDQVYVPAIEMALRANPVAALELLRVAGVPIDLTVPADTAVANVVAVLWHGVFATNDTRARLGGNPYDNTARQYTGSSNDVLLNTRVARFAADPPTRIALAFYRTSGLPGVPLVVIHTTGDPIVPAWQALIYHVRAQQAGSTRVTVLPVPRWGHCNFTLGEALIGLAVLLGQTDQAASLGTRSGVSQTRAPSVRSSIEP